MNHPQIVIHFLARLVNGVLFADKSFFINGRPQEIVGHKHHLALKPFGFRGFITQTFQNLPQQRGITTTICILVILLTDVIDAAGSLADIKQQFINPPGRFHILLGHNKQIDQFVHIHIFRWCGHAKTPVILSDYTTFGAGFQIAWPRPPRRKFLL